MARLTLARLLLAAPGLLSLAGLAAADAVLDLQEKGRPNIDAQIALSETCTQEKLAVRREWCVTHTYKTGYYAREPGLTAGKK